MTKPFYILFLILALCFSSASAQMYPPQGSTLNYRLTKFSVPESDRANRYVFTIAKGYHSNPKEFEKNIVLNHSDSVPHTMVTLPGYNQKFTWRATYMRGPKEIRQTDLYHFSTLPFYDTLKNVRFTLIQEDTIHKGLYVLHDYTRAMYDLKGNAVWFLPNIPGKTDEQSRIRDLRVTQFGTFTFLTDTGAYEIDYNGNILWEAPDNGIVSNDSSEFYHHEFTRLSNGNYMVAGNEFIYKALPDGEDTSRYRNISGVKRENGQLYMHIDCGTLIEYDIKGNVVWSWKSSEHLSEIDFSNSRTLRGTVKFNTHMNSFYFDEKDSLILVSYRDIDRIQKIKYPSGQVLANYTDTSMFRGQHCCRANDKNDIYLFNNNGPLKTTGKKNRQTLEPSIIMFKDIPGSKRFETIWEFPCNIDTFSKGHALTGGSVYELEDQSFLVGMGGANRMFIVNRNKQILWNIVITMKNGNNDWIPVTSYRVSPFTMNDLKKSLNNLK